MTPADLDAIRRLTENATPGPWEADTFHEYMDDGHREAVGGAGPSHEFGFRYPKLESHCWKQAEADAAFIAAARTFTPQLLAEIDRLREEVNTAEDAALERAAETAEEFGEGGVRLVFTDQIAAAIRGLKG